MNPSAAPPTKGPWYWSAEVGVLGLGLALALSTVRLFIGPEPVLLLVGVAVLAWALAALLPRAPLRAGLAEALHLLIGAGLALVVVGHDTSWHGLPTAAAFGQLGDSIRTDFSSFSDSVAPVTAGTGHLVVVAGAIWVLALFASSASIRMRSPVQGAVPHVTAIVALGIVARLPGRTWSTVVLLGALTLYALTQAAWRNASLRWMPGGRRGITAPLGAGALLLGACGVAALALAPLVPGDSRPVVDLRQGGAGRGPRSVVSPFVEVGSNLGPRSNQLLFTVESPVASYWRLTALDEYDPTAGIWVLSNSYDAVDGSLRDPGDDEVYDTRVTVDGLGGFWVPTTPDPVQATSPVPLGWDATSGSLIARGQDLTTGDAVEMTSAVATTDEQRLRSARPPDAVEQALVDDAGTPASLAREAERIAGTLAPYEQALALQDWFRTGFTYDDTVDFSGSPDPLEEFIQVRRGFCQQFSTAFALAARSLGLPTRVVVGFTPGDATSRPGGGQQFGVRGRHAHAWPEVLFDDLGWVSFEPTPGRGDPSTTGVTGVDGAQAAPADADSPVEQLTTTTSPPTSAAPAGGPTGAGEGSEQSVTAGAAPPGDQDDGGPWWPAPALAAGVAVVTAAVVLRRRRRATSGNDHEAPDAVAGAWRSTLGRLAEAGLRPEPSETPNEFAGRVAPDLGRGGPAAAGAADDITLLAALESGRRWSGSPPDEPSLLAASAAAERLAAAIIEGEPEHAHTP